MVSGLLPSQEANALCATAISSRPKAGFNRQLIKFPTGQFILSSETAQIMEAADNRLNDR
jgi:hypothetical protein